MTTAARTEVTRRSWECNVTRRSRCVEALAVLNAGRLHRWTKAVRGRPIVQEECGIALIEVFRAVDGEKEIAVENRKEVVKSGAGHENPIGAAEDCLLPHRIRKTETRAQSPVPNVRKAATESVPPRKRDRARKTTCVRVGEGGDEALGPVVRVVGWQLNVVSQADIQSQFLRRLDVVLDEPGEALATSGHVNLVARSKSVDGAEEKARK